MQGKNTLPHFFLGAASEPGLAFAVVALVAVAGFAAAADAALDVAADLAVPVATAFCAVGPGVTIGALLWADDVSAALGAAAITGEVGARAAWAVATGSGLEALLALGVPGGDVAEVAAAGI